MITYPSIPSFDKEVSSSSFSFSKLNWSILPADLRRSHTLILKFDFFIGFDI
jgi:hypothetical protein